ncbi:MAG: PIG-L family deacetylase [Candidatus Liptonbacteria bacterium]|nr:PIG-L family deacetylase [Candidatus Liptonbacteria bacterium]
MNLKLAKGKALVVVAHPDDETIWMGGTMQKNANVEWTIFSLCRSDDKDRAPRFRSVVKIYKANGIISDLEDEGRLGLMESIPEIEKRLISKLMAKNFDYIFTHGKNGEYGHERHKGVYLAVKNLLRVHKLQAKKFYTFAYEIHKSDQYAIPQKRADFDIKLSDRVYKNKLNLIQNIYGFNPDSFESKSCSKIEKFNIFNI